MKLRIFTTNRLLKISKLINAVEQDRGVAKMLLLGEKPLKRKGWPRYRIIISDGEVKLQKRWKLFSKWVTNIKNSYSDETKKQLLIKSFQKEVEEYIEKDKVKYATKYIINF